MSKNKLTESRIYTCCLCHELFRAKQTNLRSLSITSARCFWAEKTRLMADKHELLALFVSNQFLLCYACSAENRHCTLSHSLNVLIGKIRPCTDLSWRRPMYDENEDSLVDLPTQLRLGFLWVSAVWG